MELGNCNVVRMSLDQLNPAPYNPREIDDKSFSGLSYSVDKFGLMSLIIWNKRTGHIVGGHQRYKVLQEAGETETDVVEVDLSDEEEIALNIALNNPKSRGDFSADVAALLAKSEIQIGSAFNHLRLNDLDKLVQNMDFNLNEREEKPKEKKKREKKAKEKNQTFLNEDVQDNSNEPEAIIKCPKCSSLWRMKDNNVIYNGGK